MNPRLTLATAARILRQLRADHRTIAMMLVVPCVLIGLLAWIYDGTPVFDRIGAALLGVFPFVVMFIVTSVATLRRPVSAGRLRAMRSVAELDAVMVVLHLGLDSARWQICATLR